MAALVVAVFAGGTLAVAALVGPPLLAAATSWDHVPSRSTAVDSTIDLASIDSIDFTGSIGLPLIDSIDFIGSIGLASIDSIDFIGSIGLASIGSIDFIDSIGLASIASIDLPSVVRSSDLGSPFRVAALTHTAAPAILAYGLRGGGAGGGRATERERRTMARQRLSGTPYRRACSSPPGTRAPILTPERQHAFRSPGATRFHSSCVHQHVFGTWIPKPDTSDCAAPLQLIGNH